jgi:hypothetical protein
VFIRPSGAALSFFDGPNSATAGQPVIVNGGTTTIAGRIAQIRMDIGAPAGPTALAGGLVSIAAEVKGCGG